MLIQNTTVSTVTALRDRFEGSVEIPGSDGVTPDAGCVAQQGHGRCGDGLFCAAWARRSWRFIIGLSSVEASASDLIFNRLGRGYVPVRANG